MRLFIIDHIPTILTFFFYSFLEYKKGLDGKKENSYPELIINTAINAYQRMKK